MLQTVVEFGYPRTKVEEVYDQLWLEGIEFDNLEQGIDVIINRLEV